MTDILTLVVEKVMEFYQKTSKKAPEIKSNE